MLTASGLRAKFRGWRDYSPSKKQLHAFFSQEVDDGGLAGSSRAFLLVGADLTYNIPDSQDNEHRQRNGGGMANEEHLKILEQGVEAWNKWRAENRDIRPDLSRAYLSGAHLSGAHLNGAFLSEAYLTRADLSGTDLSGADLSGAHLREAELNRADLSRANLCEADLSEAHLSKAHLIEADLSEAHLSWADLSEAHLSMARLIEADIKGAHLSGADLSGARLNGAFLSKAYLTRADLSGAHLSGADLSGTHLNMAHLIGADLSWAHLRGADLNRADLSRANLYEADLCGADLGGASLEMAVLTGTNLDRADLANCLIYGISTWGLKLEGTTQSNLIITRRNEPTITVDNVEVAQFIYLLLNNKSIRAVIDTITTKVVLILGRFIPERQAVLDALRAELRKRDYLPVVLDFDPSARCDLTKTVSTLAHMSRFIIADISEPRSIPQELEAIVPSLSTVAIRPIIVQGQHEYGMFEHFRNYPWVLPMYEYKDMPHLLASLSDQVIALAEAKVKELRSSLAGQALGAEATDCR